MTAGREPDPQVQMLAAVIDAVYALYGKPPPDGKKLQTEVAKELWAMAKTKQPSGEEQDGIHWDSRRPEKPLLSIELAPLG